MCGKCTTRGRYKKCKQSFRQVYVCINWRGGELTLKHVGWECDFWIQLAQQKASCEQSNETSGFV